MGTLRERSEVIDSAVGKWFFHGSNLNLMRYFEMESIKKFLRDEEGLTTVEYAIAGSLVGAAVVLAFTDLGTAVRTVIEGITADIS